MTTSANFQNSSLHPKLDVFLQNVSARKMSELITATLQSVPPVVAGEKYNKSGLPDGLTENI